MINKDNKMIYFVADLRNSFVYIIDGGSNEIIKKVEIGPRPQNIIIDKKNHIYIASDRNNKITLINNLYDVDKTWYIPNNGNIQIDSASEKLYVSNTDEVCIYNLKTEEKIHSIKGFMAADCLCLSNNKERLFTLDILQNEIKVYDTVNFKLITSYTDIGSSPQFIYLEDSGNYLYVANKGSNKRKKSSDIAVIEIDSGNLTWINLDSGSAIMYLEQNGNFLYAVNSGLNRIDVIDIVKRKSIGIIKTTLSHIQKIKLSPDKKFLVATSINSTGKSVIDTIDIPTKSIINTFVFNEKNINPYEIAIINEEIKKENHQENRLEIKKDVEYDKYDAVKILAKKVISSYEEKMIFNNVEITISSPNNKDEEVRIEKIRFKKCIVSDESKHIEYMDDKDDYSILEYNFIIPYYVSCLSEHDEKYIVEGKIKGSQKASLYIPDFMQQQGVEFVINSYTQLIKKPSIVNNTLEIYASALISTRAVIEEEIYLPNCRQCKGDSD